MRGWGHDRDSERISAAADLPARRAVLGGDPAARPGRRRRVLRRAVRLDHYERGRRRRPVPDRLAGRARRGRDQPGAGRRCRRAGLGDVRRRQRRGRRRRGRDGCGRPGDRRAVRRRGDRPLSELRRPGRRGVPAVGGGQLSRRPAGEPPGQLELLPPARRRPGSGAAVLHGGVWLAVHRPAVRRLDLDPGTRGTATTWRRPSTRAFASGRRTPRPGSRTWSAA